MLSRTLSRTGNQFDRGRWRLAIIALTALVIAAGAFLALPKPGPRLRETDLTDADVRAAVAKLTVPANWTNGPAKRELAQLGRKLFSDPRFSAKGDRACATCHAPDHYFSSSTAASEGQRDVPSVVNSALSTWFNWDGRSDSLLSQALDAAEDPHQLATTRTAVVQRLLSAYRTDYENAFGEFPKALMDASLPNHGAPARPQLTLSIDVGAQALATVGTYELLRDILETTQASHRTPAIELSRRAFSSSSPTPPIAWIAAYEALPEETRQAIDQVFVNFGRALAAYQRGLLALDSPFDRFAHRIRSGMSTKEALATEFSDHELAGLKLFLADGNCYQCHNGPAFSDQQFHNVGLPPRPSGDSERHFVNVGRAAGVLIAKADRFNCLNLPSTDSAPEQDTVVMESCRELPYLDSENLTLIGAYKTPTLRNVQMTAPYMHDGRFATLDEVFHHFDRLEGRPEIGAREGSLKPLGFTAEERAALGAFLASLTAVIHVN